MKVLVRVVAGKEFCASDSVGEGGLPFPGFEFQSLHDELAVLGGENSSKLSNHWTDCLANSAGRARCDRKTSTRETTPIM